jgi:hypothetical protein
MYAFYKTTLIASLVAACSVLLTTAITAEPRSTPQTGDYNAIVLPTSSKGILSQCGDYYTFNPAKQFYGVVPDAYDKDFIPTPPMSVPVYGFMVDRAFPVEEALKAKQGENKYTAADINRALWEGHSFIWMDMRTAPETYTYVQDYANNWNKTHEKKVIALSWTGDIAATAKEGKPVEKRLPLGREFAFSSWNISQSCMSFSEAAFEEFLEYAEQHNAIRATSPVPVATLSADGSLPQDTSLLRKR